MPPKTAKPPAPTPRPDDALKKLLSLPQLLELAALITDIASAMSAQINNGFDTTFKTSKEAPQILKENERNPNIVSDAEGRSDDAPRLRTRRDVEAPELRALKADAMEFFQLWRDEITSRIVEAATSKTEAEDEEVDEAPAGRSLEPDKTIGNNINTEHSDATLTQLYPPTKTSLSSLPHVKRTSLLSALLLLLLSKGYPSHSRILMMHLTSSLLLPLHTLTSAETTLAKGLVEAAKHLSAAEETKARSESNVISRRWKVGLAGVAGAALIGVTGGLAAPLVAAGIGTIMGGIGLGGTLAAGLLGAISGSGIIVGSLFGAYGYGMTSKMMDEYAKEVEDFAFIPLKGGRRRAQGQSQGVQDVNPEDRKLRVTIGISGWLTQKRDVITPWRVLGHGNEVFALRWELESLLKMGKSLESVVSSAVWTVASTEIISRTVFASLMFALWPIGLLKISKIVDNPFTAAKNRADKAGLVLADALINKAQGERPVTLIGYSMGARVIYSCLISLAERRAFGLVESAVLIGAPTPSDAKLWRALRSVVAGRLVNVYAEKDYILAFLYRTSSIQYGIAGLQEIRDVKGVENVDVTPMVSGHLRYQHLVGSILEKIGWEDVNIEEVKKEKLFIAMLDEEESKAKMEKPTSQQSNQAEGDLISFGDGPEPTPPVQQHGQPAPPTSKTSDDLLGMLMGSDEVVPAATKHDERRRSSTAKSENQYPIIQRDSPVVSRAAKPSNDLLDMLMSNEDPNQDVEKGRERKVSPAAVRSDKPRRTASRKTLDLFSTSADPDDPLAAITRAEPELQSAPQRGVTRTPKPAVVVKEQRQPSESIREDRGSSDDEGGNGIVMLDNDDTGITMLDPVAMEDDDEGWSGWKQK